MIEKDELLNYFSLKNNEKEHYSQTQNSNFVYLHSFGLFTTRSIQKNDAAFVVASEWMTTKF